MTEIIQVRLQFDDYTTLEKCRFGLFEFEGAVLWKIVRPAGFAWYIVALPDDDNDPTDELHNKSPVRPARLILDLPAVPVAGEVR